MGNAVVDGAVLTKLVTTCAVAVIVSVAAFTAGFGDASVASKAVESIARQPEAKSSITTAMLIGIGLVEATPLIAIGVAFFLLFGR
ncbi:MAG: F0F1 ATP synthase subunit C [Bacillota bacterium]